VDYNNSFIFNLSSFCEQINVSLAFFHKDIQVFSIYKYSQIMLLASEKAKKKALLLGEFWYFNMDILYNKEEHEGHFSISQCICYFLIEKQRVCVLYAPASRRCPCH
jgi:hypothetical protein